MPRKPPARKSARTTSTGASGSTVLAFVLGAVAAAGAAYLYLHSTPHPAVGSEPPASQHSTSQNAPAPIASTPAGARSTLPVPPPRATAPSPPFGTSEDVFEAGAHIYAARCAACHGTPRSSTRPGPPATPAAPQLWHEARSRIVALPPGDLYLDTSVGAPAKGMPAFAHVLTETQIWQVTLLLKNADQDLPDPVVNILNTPAIR